jgi:hypothetical protein
MVESPSSSSSGPSPLSTPPAPLPPYSSTIAPVPEATGGASIASLSIMSLLFTFVALSILLHF